MDRGKPPKSDGDDAFSSYAGRWVAHSGNRVIAQGGTPEQARRAAQASRPKERPDVQYIPYPDLFVFHPLVNQIIAVLPSDGIAFLVGGAVRDAMLSRLTHDLDFVLPGHAIQTARKVADSLNGHFYPLDPERDFGRVILTQPNSERFVIDFTVYQGPDLESDLLARDFTVNAMAVDVHQPQALLDPLSGANDLRNKQIRFCRPDSFQNDPIRILRGVRLANSLDFRIHADTRQQMRTDAHLISNTSPERLRDEILRTFDGPKPASALRAFDLLGVFSVIFPELVELKDIHQSPPHVSDVWDHTLSVVKYLHTMINVLSLDSNQDDAASLHLGLVSALIGRYREQLANHLETCLTPDRSSRSLLYLAALYHDSGKPLTRQIEQSGRIRFIDHEKVGAAITTSRAHALVLSNPETDRLTTIVRHHMRPLLLAQSKELPSRKAIYRFFRDTGPAGVDIALLSLADTLATYGPTLPQGFWAHQVEVVRTLLQAWWEQPQESISPVPLVDGFDLIQELNLSSGPLIGKILEEIREAQATGLVTNRGEALDLARKTISDG